MPYVGLSSFYKHLLSTCYVSGTVEYKDEYIPHPVEVHKLVWETSSYNNMEGVVVILYDIIVIYLMGCFCSAWYHLVMFQQETCNYGRDSEM